MVKTRLIRHSPQWSVCDVRDLRHRSRAFFKINTKKTKFGLIGMHFLLRKHIYFHGSDILSDLKVYALDFHNWVDF